MSPALNDLNGGLVKRKGPKGDDKVTHSLQNIETPKLMKIFKDGHFCLSLNYYFNFVCKILGLTVNIFVCKKRLKNLRVFFAKNFELAKKRTWRDIN